MDDLQESKIIVGTSRNIMITNFFLAVIKILAGIFGHSMAIISDAVNSISDILTNIVVMISGKYSRRGIDKDHPYGHEKFESMVSVLLGVAIVVTAFEIAREAVQKLIDYFANGTAIQQPNYIALIVALVTIAVKECLYHYTKRNAKRAASSALRAQAIDHRGDELASFGAFLGIGGAMLGYLYLEPIASLVICGFIGRLGIKIIKDGISQVVDEAASEADIAKIKEIVSRHPEVQSIDELRTRQFGMKIYVDLEICLDGSFTLEKSHRIAEAIHDEIEAEMSLVKHCMIHVNPGKKQKI